MNFKNKLSLFLFGSFIYFSNDSIVSKISLVGGQLIVFILGIISSILLFFLIRKKLSIKNDEFRNFFLYFLLITFTVVSAYEFSGGYVSQILLFFCSFLIVKILSFDKTIEMFVRLIFVVLFLSLTLDFLNVVFPTFSSIFPKVENLSGLSLRFAIFSSLDFDNYYRLKSFFREPGVFGIYLVFAMICCMYLKKDVKYIAILFLAVVLTKSTPAIIASLAIMSVLIFKKASSSFYLFITALPLIIIFTPEISNITEQTFDKFDDNSDSYISFLSRAVSLGVGFSIFLDNPIFGAGINGYSEEFPRQAYELSGMYLESADFSSNTLLSVLAVHGIFFFALVFFFVFRTALRLGRHDLKLSYLFIAVLILMLSSQDMRNSPLFFLIMSLGFVYKKN